VENGLLSDGELHHAIVPALDHVTNTDLGLERLIAVNGGVELGATISELNFIIFIFSQ
jgi:hypothetical protein